MHLLPNDLIEFHVQVLLGGRRTSDSHLLTLYTFRGPLHTCTRIHTTPRGEGSEMQVNKALSIYPPSVQPCGNTVSKDLLATITIVHI